MKVLRSELIGLLCLVLVSCHKTTPTAPTAPKDLKIEAYSAGYAMPNAFQGAAEFDINSTPVYGKQGGGGGGRGFNVVLLDNTTGAVLQPGRSFDTWADNGTNIRALLDFLNAIPDKTLVLIAVADEAGITYSNSCDHRRGDYATLESVLTNLGSTRISDYCFRSAWSMIAVKGEGKKDEQLSTTAPVTSTYTIHLQ